MESMLRKEAKALALDRDDLAIFGIKPRQPRGRTKRR